MKKKNAAYFADILYGFLEDAESKEIAPRIKKFLTWMEQRGARQFFPKLAAAYQEIARRRQGITKVQIITARETLGMDSLTKKLSDQDKVEVERSLDSSLLGGAIVQMGDTRWDASLSGRIKELKRLFIEGIHN